ncbi:unnamed protein product [Mortierella alpina]
MLALSQKPSVEHFTPHSHLNKAAMTETQSFQLLGATEIVKIPIQNVDGHKVVAWESIEHAFPGARCVKHDDVPVPCFIKYVADAVLKVALSSTFDDVRGGSSEGSPSIVPVSALGSSSAACGGNASDGHPVDPSSEDKSVEELRVASALVATPISAFSHHVVSTTSSTALPTSPLASVRTSLKTTLSFKEVVQFVSERAQVSDSPAYQQELNAQMARMLQLQQVSDGKQDKMIQLVIDHHEEIKRLKKDSDAKQDEMIQLQKESEAKQNEMNLLQEQLLERQTVMEQLQIAAAAKQEEMNQLDRAHQEKMEEMQQRILDQVSALHARVQALLTQTFELHEYPIPRLFVVLPDDPSTWNALDPFSNKFRLYFLCECGDHTKALNSNTKIPHHIHLAKHEGYVISRPSEFFEQYGPYVLTILKMLKFGVTVAGLTVPAISQLVSPDGLSGAIDNLKLLQECIVPGVDCVISSMDQTAVDDGDVIEGVTGQVENKEALEGVELRRLGSFLQDNDANQVLGNLYRTVTYEGHVKWVCIDHYRENYQARTATEFRSMLTSVKGEFDEHLGRVKVDLQSRVQADLFYGALVKAKSVHELNINLNWDTTYADFKNLRDTLRRTNIGVLRFSHRGTAIDVVNRGQRYDPIVQIMSHPSIKSFAMTNVQRDFLQRSNLVAADTDFSNLKHLVISGFKVDGFMDKFYMVRAPGLTTLELPDNSIDDNGAQMLAEELQTNSTLVTLDLASNNISSHGAQALAKVLTTNTTLTTLALQGNRIGYSGMVALAPLRETISLCLYGNSIKEYGFQKLSDALNGIFSGTSMDLSESYIGDDGTQALAEVLQANKTLITVDLKLNGIAESGAQALAVALKTNETLTTLNLGGNSIGDDGAKALAVALKTNETLTTMELGGNSIGDDGTKALAVALKTNETLTTLDLGGNSIGDDGAKALAEALKINKTLTTLNLPYNRIGDSGAQALAEALKTNKALIAVYLHRNKMGDNGALALAEALKANRSLTTLDLSANRFEVRGAQALNEANRTSKTLTTLKLV